MPSDLLKIDKLRTVFETPHGLFTAIDDISFSIGRGETVCLVGESGAGKSVTALSIMRLLGRTGQIASGEIYFDGQNLPTLSEQHLASLRGNRIAMIFQDPLSSLNPVRKAGHQVAEVLEIHLGFSRQDALSQAVDLLRGAGLPQPEFIAERYPHQLSGGQAQRVMIAMALACSPDLLIADEPTTALDVTVQAQILNLLTELKQRQGMTLLLITHDMGVVAQMADRVIVLRDGKVVEIGTSEQIFDSPKHEYTRTLVRFSEPSLPELPAPQNGKPVIRVSHLTKHYPVRAGLFRRQVGTVHAVDDVTLNIQPGETLALVGESGCGKTTLGKTILRLEEPNSGDIYFDNHKLTEMRQRQIKPLRRDMQMVYQDPLLAFDPRITVGESIAEGLKIHRLGNRSERTKRVATSLLEVGLSAEDAVRKPASFSGGQRQRIGIARALALRPKFIVLDEPVSALDVVARTRILELLRRLQRKYNMAYLFISHDMRVVQQVAHRVAVMYLGQIVEVALADQLFDQPLHPYTRALLNAVPSLEPGAPHKRVLPGEVPGSINPPPACRFHTRCPIAIDKCAQIDPEWREFRTDQWVACHLAE